jgi:hypothetical protein
MNPIALLTNGLNDLWFWTYGIIAGWGLTITLVVVALILLLIRTINLQRRVDRLEQRLVHAERDYNLSINHQNLNKY